MKLNHLVSSGLLAITLAVTAQAQVVTAGLGDMILGFKKTGATNNLEVNLGNISNFQSGGTYATGSEYFLTQLSAADLTAQFTTWTGLSTVTFGVAGTNGAGGGFTIWASDKNLATALTPGASQGTASNAIASVYNGLNNATATANSASAAAILASGPNSWSTKSATGNNFGGSFLGNLASNTLALTGTGGSTFVQLDLYQLVNAGAAQTTSDRLGSFKLYDDGTFSFTSFTAIPEPSTYAAILGIVTLGVVAIRRRRQATIEV